MNAGSVDAVQGSCLEVCGGASRARTGSRDGVQAGRDPCREQAPGAAPVDEGGRSAHERREAQDGQAGGCRVETRVGVSRGGECRDGGTGP